MNPTVEEGVASIVRVSLKWGRAVGPTDSELGASPMHAVPVTVCLSLGGFSNYTATGLGKEQGTTEVNLQPRVARSTAHPSLHACLPKMVCVGRRTLANNPLLINTRNSVCLHLQLHTK